MGLHIYCIAPVEHGPDAGLLGIADAPVTTVAAGSLLVWASAHDAPPDADLAAVRSHNRVVTAAMDDRVTPVPVRFGQWFEDADTAAARIGGDAVHWRALLHRFAGHAEYGVRVITGVTAPARDMHAAAAETGTAYMAGLARRAAEARAGRHETDRIAAVFAARIGSLAAATHADTAGGTLSLAHLVAWNDATSYHSVVRTLREEETALRFICTGPWPPYTFVE